MPAYRNRGISGRLQRFLFERWVPVRHDIAGLFGEPVCNHIHVQKNWHDLGALETGLEVALMPASAYGSNTDKKGRVSCLSAYWAVADRPHKVHLPAVYEKALRFLYRGLTQERSFCVSIDPLPSGRSTRWHTTVFDFASVARVAFQETGSDLKVRIEAIERELREQGVKVIQVWLKLSSPWTGDAVNTLRGHGYFLGGLLPRWFDDDGLSMQKLFCPPDWEGIQLYTDRSRTILDMVREDRNRVTAGRP
jgi:hypothetical protein